MQLGAPEYYEGKSAFIAGFRSDLAVGAPGCLAQKTDLLDSTRVPFPWSANSSTLLLSSSGGWLPNRRSRLGSESGALCFAANLAITPELVLDTIRLIGSNTSTVFFERSQFNSDDPAFLSRRGARARWTLL